MKAKLPDWIDGVMSNTPGEGRVVTVGGMTISAADGRRWKYGHLAKVTYRNRWRAERWRWQVYLSDRNWMQVYSCRWTRELSAGETGEEHWHIGHGKGCHGPLERVRHQWRRLVLWRYFRLRHRYRVARGKSGCVSPSCKAHRKSVSAVSPS